MSAWQTVYLWRTINSGSSQGSLLRHQTSTSGWFRFKRTGSARLLWIGFISKQGWFRTELGCWTKTRFDFVLFSASLFLYFARGMYGNSNILNEIMKAWVFASLFISATIAKLPPECDGQPAVWDEAFGQFSSPGYSSESNTTYPNNLSCAWLIAVEPESVRITLVSVLTIRNSVWRLWSQQIGAHVPHLCGIERCWVKSDFRQRATGRKS